MLTEKEKDLILHLSRMDSNKLKYYSKEYPEDFKTLKLIFKDKRKIDDIKKLVDEKLKNVIFSKYASLAFKDNGDKKHKIEAESESREYYDQYKAMRMLLSKYGEKYTPCVNFKEKPWEYYDYNSQEDFKKAAQKLYKEGLIESFDDNTIGNLCGINESEFFDDFKAIYGEALTEGLSVELPANDCKTIFNVSLRKLLSYSDSEIRDDIKDKDNGKSVDDYKIQSGDAGLTLNYMLAYIRRSGGADEKDFIQSKIDYFMNIQDRARDKKADSFKISFASVNSVYRKFLKYRGKK